MKKILRLIMCVVMALCASGCNNGVSQEEYDRLVKERDALVEQVESLGGTVVTSIHDGTVSKNTSDNTTEESTKDTLNETKKGDFNEKEIVDNLDITDYSYINAIKRKRLFLIIKNTSAYDLEMEVRINFKDAEGNLIGAKSDSKDAVEHGYETVFSFSPDEEYATFDCEISVKEETYFDCAMSSLKCETNNAKDKTVISVSNVGDEPVDFAQYEALFFNNGKLVGYDYGYTIDSDNELKAGKTINSEASCYEQFDDVKVYLYGTI